MIDLSPVEAGQLAVEFLVEDLQIPEDDRDFFAVLSARCTDQDWCVVEVGVEGLPDKWVIQVFDTKECDPCYTFVSPVSPDTIDSDLEEFPLDIATAIANERKHQ